MKQSPSPRRTRSSLSGLLHPAVAALWLLFTVTASRAATHYVDGNNASPIPPYLTWASAATNIQDAVDASLVGDEVVVTNGIYATGSRTAPDSLSSRVVVSKPLWVHSLNGAQVTTIQGYRGPIATNYGDGIRCVYLTNGSSLSGFTLTNGAANNSGGGVECGPVNVTISNCVIVGNATATFGGGVDNGTLYNCTITGNVATNGAVSSGGGANFSTLYNCVVTTNTSIGGGGAVLATLNNCIVSGNSAVQGGGVNDCWLTNCLLSGNWATDSGGGAYSGSLFNCTLVGNSATNIGGGGYGFDSFHDHANCVLYNSIVYSNQAAMAPECECTQYDCCTPDNQSLSSGNIPGPPQFVDPADGDFRLMRTSPCIDAGNNAYISATTDLDGHPRIIGGTVDMGAYEFVPSPSMRIGRASPNITLAWPLWASNFVAQETGSLPTNSDAWSNVAATVSQTATENVVTVPSTNSAKFFRLFLP